MVVNQFLAQANICVSLESRVGMYCQTDVGVLNFLSFYCDFSFNLVHLASCVVADTGEFITRELATCLG